MILYDRLVLGKFQNRFSSPKLEARGPNQRGRGVGLAV